MRKNDDGVDCSIGSSNSVQEIWKSGLSDMSTFESQPSTTEALFSGVCESLLYSNVNISNRSCSISCGEYSELKNSESTPSLNAPHVESLNCVVKESQSIAIDSVNYSIPIKDKVTNSVRAQNGSADSMLWLLDFAMLNDEDDVKTRTSPIFSTTDPFWAPAISKIDGQLTAESLELVDEISDPLVVLHELSMIALRSFASNGVAGDLQPEQICSLFMLLATKQRALVKEETKMPVDCDLIEFDPSVEQPKEVWIGDPHLFRGLIEKNNATWSMVDEVFGILVSSGLMNPMQTWSHHSTSRPNAHVGVLLDLNVLNELMCTTLEILDFGLQATDEAMKPIIEEKDVTAYDTLILDDEFFQESKVEETEEVAVFHSCAHLDLKMAKLALHQLQVLFFSVVQRPASKDPEKSGMRKFIEMLIRCHLLIGSEEAIHIAREVLARFDSI